VSGTEAFFLLSKISTVLYTFFQGLQVSIFRTLECQEREFPLEHIMLVRFAECTDRLVECPLSRETCGTEGTFGGFLGTPITLLHLFSFYRIYGYYFFRCLLLHCHNQKFTLWKIIWLIIVSSSSSSQLILTEKKKR
jgi:hypothetical protein